MEIVFFFNYTATTEIYTYLHTLSRHDALPISSIIGGAHVGGNAIATRCFCHFSSPIADRVGGPGRDAPDFLGLDGKRDAQIRHVMAERFSQRDEAFSILLGDDDLPPMMERLERDSEVISDRGGAYPVDRGEGGEIGRGWGRDSGGK